MATNTNNLFVKLGDTSDKQYDASKADNMLNVIENDAPSEAMIIIGN